MNERQDKIFKRHPDIAWRIIDEEGILVLPQDNKITVLNPVAAFIWHVLDGRNSLEGIAGLILDEFDVSREEAEADLNNFIQNLKENRLLA